ncbi:MAG TPA: efflux RND transporter periplasmic adaptor subunit [Polyangiales bacterium]|nr:efflux RND transporter periplasmic adaptor subunit [Polyangiales bacterium]
MHPTITSDRPGDCPICGMKLVPVTADQHVHELHGASGHEVPASGPAASAASAGDRENLAPTLQGARKVVFYRSPMDAKQISPVPRKDEMGMDFLPVYQDELGGAPAKVEGRAAVAVDPARQQMIGLRTVAVERGEVGGAWRTIGRIEVDPTRVRKANVKVDGYVERIFVNFPGQSVRKGDALFTLYSPALLAAENEYVLTLRNRASESGDKRSSDALLSSTRRRLELWDVPESAIAELERTLAPVKTLTFTSPIAGVVTVKNIVEGAFLQAGSAPYEITDLSTVWVMVDAYESDLAKVHVGMEATFTLPAYPGRVFAGRVRFIEPQLDPLTRTVKVHLHFPNSGGELKPELYGEVTLRGSVRSGLRVPLDAVIYSGARAVVFVAEEQGKFRPVEVRLGDRAGDAVEVTAGVTEGQRVVTRANFLIDSESQLRASLADLAGK